MDLGEQPPASEVGEKRHSIDSVSNKLSGGNGYGAQPSEARGLLQV